MPRDLTDDKSALVQIMAWCHQSTSHYMSQCWPSSMSPYGVTRAQWVKPAFPEFNHSYRQYHEQHLSIHWIWKFLWTAVFMYENFSSLSNFAWLHHTKAIYIQYINTDLGTSFISDKMSYRKKILKSRNHETGILSCCIAWDIAAETPVKFQSNQTILYTSLMTLRLQDPLTFFLSNIEVVP